MLYSSAYKCLLSASPQRIHFHSNAGPLHTVCQACFSWFLVGWLCGLYKATWHPRLIGGHSHLCGQTAMQVRILETKGLTSLRISGRRCCPLLIKAVASMRRHLLENGTPGPGFDLEHVGGVLHTVWSRGPRGSRTPFLGPTRSKPFSQ